MSAPKHESAGNEVTADGIVHRCSCGWVSPPCFSNAAASCLGIDHRAQAKPTNGEGSVMNTTPPLTDAEFLAYIERTPELAALFPDAARWLSPHAAPYANVARAFHAHEQRVREEEREACAKLIEQRGELSAALAEVKRLNEWADGMTDAALKERQTGEMYQRELRAEIERLRQQQDELVWRVVVIFREELCDSLIGDAPPPTVSKIIARVRAEMEKERAK